MTYIAEVAQYYDLTEFDDDEAYCQKCGLHLAGALVSAGFFWADEDGRAFCRGCVRIYRDDELLHGVGVGG